MKSRPILKLGTSTVWGKIVAVGIREGERYYQMIDKHGTVALMPAETVETMYPQKGFNLD